MALSGHMMVIHIQDFSMSSDDDLQTFFCTLYAGVHHLIDNCVYNKAVYNKAIPYIQPNRFLFLDCCLSPDNTFMPARVFLKDNFIYKLYDTNEEEINLSLVQLSLPEAV